MKKELIESLTENFESHAQESEGGVEYWLARDRQCLLGYAEWRNFSNTMISCEMSGHAVSDHFVDVNKMVELSSGGQREAGNFPHSCRESAVETDGWAFMLPDCGFASHVTRDMHRNFSFPIHVVHGMIMPCT